MNAGDALMPAVLGVAAICAVLAVIFLAAIVHIGRGKAEPTDIDEPRRPSPMPLGERFLVEWSAEIDGQPAATFSAGDETDVAQILKAVR